MGRPKKTVDEALMVGMYREGMSLRAVAAMQGVSQTTVASCLEKAGQWRRRTQEENQRRWPRVRRVCAPVTNPSQCGKVTWRAAGPAVATATLGFTARGLVGIGNNNSARRK
jgi:hypothetical protein